MTYLPVEFFNLLDLWRPLPVLSVRLQLSASVFFFSASCCMGAKDYGGCSPSNLLECEGPV